MKLKWLFFIAVTFIFSNCNAQEKKTGLYQKKDSVNEPKEDIIVNKEYDEEGNLIKYDSTYTYYYSNIDDDVILEDSIFNDFRKMFDIHYPFSHKPSFDNLFFTDSLMQFDFYKKDFFTERFRKNLQQTEKMFQEMDSIKNKYFGEQFPDKK